MKKITSLTPENMFDEPEIIINGTNLSLGCSMTVRMALEIFATYLSQDSIDDILGKELTKNYLNRIEDIRRAMYKIKN